MSEEVQGLKDLVQQLQAENDRLRREQTSGQPSSGSTSRTDGHLVLSVCCIYPERESVPCFEGLQGLGLRNG